MQRLAKLAPIPKTELDQVVAMDRGACPASRFQWSNGLVARDNNGQWNYPNGLVFRYTNGQVNYPNGLVMTYANGQLNYPNGLVARYPNGGWLDTNGLRATPETLLATACAKRGASWCADWRRFIDGQTGWWHDLAVVEMAWNGR
ncbi:MAG: hypothetical protein QM765_45730 [Myxococcales bacterium]